MSDSNFKREVLLSDLRATEALGARIAAGLRAGDAVAPRGDFGGGEDGVLARAILTALGVREDVLEPDVHAGCMYTETVARP